MVRNIVNRINCLFNQLEQTIHNIFGGFPPSPLCTTFLDFYDEAPKRMENSSKPISLKDIVEEGFLWAVPKCRRPIEVRLSRRFGREDGAYKMLKPKKNLIMCHNCGYDHEIGMLCQHCYTKVKVETDEMQKAIIDKLGLDPVEKDVVILYEGEKQSQLIDFWKKQRIVELPKKRPVWFHSNLLQPTTDELSETKEVKPMQLA